MSNYKFIISTVVLLFISSYVFSQEVSRPDAHAPIGIMGDHVHHKGEFMFSYRFMHMFMKGNRIGTEDIGSDDIVTTIPNRFSVMPMQPSTLRVVPLEMTMNMHMVGMMYAPSDRVTLMGMAMILSNSMDLLTYQGGTGTNALGNFATESSGFGDTKLTVMYRLDDHIHVNLGMSVPTGSIEEGGQVLTPMNMEVTLRMPYPMQLGSGTWDLLPALTYTKRVEGLGYGAQTSGIIRIGENDNGYTFGNRFDVTAWGSLIISKWLSSSLRMAYFTQGKIDGIDPGIVAPVQTADPNFQGGSRIDGFIGLNAIGQSGFIKEHRLSIEFGIPLYQDLNGPQLETQSVLTIGWQYAF